MLLSSFWYNRVLSSFSIVAVPQRATNHRQQASGNITLKDSRKKVLAENVSKYANIYIFHYATCGSGGLLVQVDKSGLLR